MGNSHEKTAITVTPEIATDRKGRNPELTGIKHDVYMFVRQHPGCSRKDVCAGLSLRHSSGTGRVTELLDSGLLVEDGVKLDPVSKKRVKRLFAAMDYLHKNPRDRVGVWVSLIVDEDGNYHAKAHVAGGVKHMDPTKKSAVVYEKYIRIVAPYPNEYRSMFIDDDLSVVDPRDTMTNSKLIIDG